MIQQHFKDLIEIKGIDAVALYDNHNRIMDSWVQPPKQNIAVISEIGETYLHIFGLLEYLKSDMSELVLPHDKGIIYARTRPKYFIIVMAKLSIDAALIRLALNVAIKEFEENRKSKKVLKKLSDKKFYQIKSITLDDVEKIMLENILEDKDGGGE